MIDSRRMSRTIEDPNQDLWSCLGGWNMDAGKGCSELSISLLPEVCLKIFVHHKIQYQKK